MKNTGIRIKKIIATSAGIWLVTGGAISFGQITEFETVSDADLRNPPPGQWLNWRGTDNAWGYSSLNQINKENVSQLQLVWSWAMDDTGAGQAAPLVRNGVMFVPGPRGVVQALDASNGDLIWEYRPGITPPLDDSDQSDFDPDLAESSLLPSTSYAGVGRGVQKNIAIFGDMIYAATEYASIIALDARSGRPVWESQTADPALGYFYTAGPIVASGVVITGITGCDRYKDDVCFITGHDALSGEELWRTSTVARPEDPGGDTWGELPLRFRAGSDAWIAGSYDANTNLVYWATAQAKPWARAVRGTDGDALYTNSSLALNPDTGEIIWHYQYLPGETHDMDEVFESLLIDIDGRQSLFKMGKLGILWEIDRSSGEFISAVDLGYQNIINVNPVTGEVRYRDGMIPRLGEEIDMCPSTSGFKSWRAMSYNPITNGLYIPITLNCELATFGPTEQVLGGGGTGPVRRINYLHPDSEGKLGELLAINAGSGEVMWRQRSETPVNTASLSTAGGLVFAGDWNRYVYAYDADNGNILWQSRLTTSAQGFPISYSVDGKQYIAIPAGVGGASWSGSLPRELAPDMTRPNNGNSIYIFALPE